MSTAKETVEIEMQTAKGEEVLRKLAPSWFETLLNIAFWIVHLIVCGVLIGAMVGTIFPQNDALYWIMDISIGGTVVALIEFAAVRMFMITANARGSERAHEERNALIVHIITWALLSCIFIAGVVILIVVWVGCSTYPECYALTAADVVKSDPASVATPRFITLFVAYAVEMFMVVGTTLVMTVALLLHLRFKSAALKGK
jgi:hypothetical protein